MLHKKLDDSIHIETSAPGLSVSCQFEAAYLRFSRYWISAGMRADGNST